MPLITYIALDGSSQTLDVKKGTSVMQAALLNDVTGIVGECGGAAMCATCHVYVDTGSESVFPAPSDVELAMLESVASERKQCSRLGCQLVLSEETEVTVRLPERQV